MVVAGKGNNGNDGREAARRLRRRGVRVVVIAAADTPERAACVRPGDRRGVRDRVPGRVRAARRRGRAGAGGGHPQRGRRPDRGGGGAGPCGPGAPSPSPPSSRACCSNRAGRWPARWRWPTSGSTPRAPASGVVEAADVAGWLPPRLPDAHKWRAAVVIAAGSPGMAGAAHLAARAAQRAGAGMVRVASPGIEHDPALPTEAVGVAVPTAGWDDAVMARAGTGRGARPGPGPGPQRPDGHRHPPPGLGRARPGGGRRRRPVGPGRSGRGDPVAAGRRPRCSPPTTASTPGWPATRRATTVWPRPATWPRPPVRSCCSRGRPPWWPSPAAGSGCPPRATPGSPPQARATCCPA